MFSACVEKIRVALKRFDFLSLLSISFGLVWTTFGEEVSVSLIIQYFTILCLIFGSIYQITVWRIVDFSDISDEPNINRIFRFHFLSTPSKQFEKKLSFPIFIHKWTLKMSENDQINNTYIQMEHFFHVEFTTFVQQNISKTWWLL